MNNTQSLADRQGAYTARRCELDDKVLRGEIAPPPCFTCKGPATFVTDKITPAGYRAYQCTVHAPENPKPLWGSDPGWQTKYVEIGAAREAYANRASAAGAE